MTWPPSAVHALKAPLGDIVLVHSPPRGARPNASTRPVLAPAMEGDADMVPPQLRQGLHVPLVSVRTHRALSVPRAATRTADPATVAAGAPMIVPPRFVCADQEPLRTVRTYTASAWPR